MAATTSTRHVWSRATDYLWRPVNGAKLYLLTLIATGLLMTGLFGAVLYGLDRTGHLPPPAVSNRLCVDEKLRFIRDHQLGNPDLLVIGSSVAWRDFDGAVYAAERPGHEEFNGGFCGLNFAQTAAAAEWLLGNLPSVRSVLLIVAPPDALACASSPAAVFDDQDATDYAFRHDWPGLLYFRYFDPVSFIRNARTVAAQRANKVPLDPLVFTPTGDGPLRTDATRDTLLYGAAKQYDPACFAALHGLAQHLASRGLHFSVVMAPLSPVWNATVDTDGQARARLAQGVQHAIAGTQTAFWSSAPDYQPAAGMFTDAIHMRWAAIPAFTRQMLAHVGP